MKFLQGIYIFFKIFSSWQSLSGQEQQSLYRINSCRIFHCCGSAGFLNRDSHVCKMLGFNLSTQSMQYSLVQCIQCGKNFNGPIGMKYHCNRVHFGQLMIICPLCDLAFITSHAYNIYLSTSHGGVEKFDERFVSMFGCYAPPY